LFPKNRGHWKQFSSWEPNQQLKDKTTTDNRFPPDVEVKKGYSWSDQLGIAIAALVEASHSDFLKWTTEESHDSFFESILSDFCFTDS
jgi:replication fork protection complex subunit Tof1/Swi1